MTLASVPTYLFPPHRLLQVVRDGKCIDTGKTFYMGGHDDSVYVRGLTETVERGRTPAHFKGETRYVGMLYPEDFREGDKVRIPIHPSKLRSWVRAWPEWFRIRAPKKKR